MVKRVDDVKKLEADPRKPILFEKTLFAAKGGCTMKKEIEAFVNAANEQELEAAWRCV